MWPFLHPKTVSQNPCPEWDAVSACDPVGKLHPTSATNSGMHFPPRSSTGNSIPFQRQIPGRIFRNPAHPESPSRSVHIREWNQQLMRPSINKGAPSCQEEGPENLGAFTSETVTCVLRAFSTCACVLRSASPRRPVRAQLRRCLRPRQRSCRPCC